VLRPVVLALHHDARRLVRQADGGIGPVNVLATRAGCAIRIGAHIRRIDFDLDIVVDHGRDGDRREARMAARRGVEWRNPHKAMHARF